MGAAQGGGGGVVWRRAEILAVVADQTPTPLTPTLARQGVSYRECDTCVIKCDT